MIPCDKRSTSYGLPSLFRARRSTLDTMPSALRSTFPGAGAVHQIVCFVMFRRWRCPVNGGNVAELLRFCRAVGSKSEDMRKNFERACRLATRLGAGVGATNYIF